MTAAYQNIFKKLVFPLISVFLAYRSWELIQTINHSDPEAYSTYTILLIALVLNIFITGIFAFPGFAFKTNVLLPKSYYKIKQAKTLTLVYQLMGVKYFKALLLIAFWGKEKNRKNYFDGTKLGLENFDTQTRQSEFGHLCALLVILVVACMLFLKGHETLCMLTTLINVIANLYPVILQRMHRVQIERMQKITSTRYGQR